MDEKYTADIVAVRVGAPPGASATKTDGFESTAPGTPNGIRSSPPTVPYDSALDTANANQFGDGNATKSDSEAETIVLPGKDGHSPSKIRKTIKHEDRSEDEETRDAPDSHRFNISKIVDIPKPSANAASALGKRKRPKHGVTDDEIVRQGNSSGLSSVPTSPAAMNRSSLSKPAASDSDVSKSPSPSCSANQGKAKSVDRVLHGKSSYVSGSGDEDEIEARRPGRQRSSGSDLKSSRDTHSSCKLSVDAGSKLARSVSPYPRGHKRSISTQLPSKSSRGLSHKKKRIPAPLQSTEYHSDDSSASGTSNARSSRVRHLAPPATGDLAISPAKMGPHKKNVNPSGQTLLAVACSRGKLEPVQKRYAERPQDLNVPDNALNTPLHIASLLGNQEIVQFLLGTGNCELDCINMIKDTPLHDAVDNQHVEVVKLLLDAGANPSKPNQAGNEPLDLLNQQSEEADEKAAELIAEMKTAIVSAKRKFTADSLRGSEDIQIHDNCNSSLINIKGSPRQTPPIQISDYQSLGNRKPGTARSLMKTKEGVLYQHLDVEALQVAARDGDEDTAARILDVNPNLNDSKTLYNAAKGGHDAVINLLFALGNFDPDPPALEGMPSDQPTPILAAIGKDHHLEVIKLFIGNAKFDPTRRVRGETYHQIAKRRGGPKCQEEEELLKKAFDAYQKLRKSPCGKNRSPSSRREVRDSDRISHKISQKEDQQTSRLHNRGVSNTKPKEADSSKSQHSKNSMNQTKLSQDMGKKGPGRSRKSDGISGTISDRETSPFGPPKQKLYPRISESDVAITSESEAATKPRRKLVSGKELRGERELEKQRRASVASNNSVISGISVKEKKDRVPSDSRADKIDKSLNNISHISKGSTSDPVERDLNPDKYIPERERPRSIKREDSKDRISVIRGESPVKRPRKSETPPRSGMNEVSTFGYDGDPAPKKRRKLDTDTSTSSMQDTPSSSPEHRPSTIKSSLSREHTNLKSISSDLRHKVSRDLKNGRTPGTNKDANICEKSSPSRLLTCSTSTPTSEGIPKKSRLSDRPSKSKDSAETSPSPAKLAKLDEEEALKQAQIRREKKEAEAVRQKKTEEEKERARVEEVHKARLAREQAVREVEEKRLKEESERKERQRIEDAEAQKRAQEEQRIKYQEQERLRREEQERRRVILQEQQRAERIRIEEEKREERLAKLPLLLKWFDQVSEPKTPEIAKLFKSIWGYRYDTIKPEATGKHGGTEQWMLNTQVAILLGEKDLQLSRYTAWERVSLSVPQKRGIWNVYNGYFVLLDGILPSLNLFPPEKNMEAVIEKNRSLFLNLDLFFVKVAEFMFVVPNFPHLRNIELEVIYKELWVPELSGTRSKWKNDPGVDPNQLWAPLPTYYINGAKIRQGEQESTRILKDAPPRDSLPRREGLTRVYPPDLDFSADYAKQGLSHQIPEYQTSPVIVTRSQSPNTNGMATPSLDKPMNNGNPLQEQVANGANGKLEHASANHDHQS